MLDHIVRVITNKIHSGDWAYDTFPTQEELRAMFHCGRRLINEALNRLETEGLLVRQAVRGGNGARLLPIPADGRPFPATAAEMVADSLIEGILNGRWAGVRFPTIHEVRDEFRCSLRVASDAMRILADDGWVHRVTVELSERARGWRWVPVEVPQRGPGEISREIEQDVRDGVLTGLLPTREAMAKSRRVQMPAVTQAYQRLQDDGVIAFGWLPDLRTRGWFVLNSAPPRLILCDSKGLALAALLRQRMSDWLIQGPRGVWFRAKMPTVSALSREYGVDYRSAERAVAVLEGCGVVERGPFASPVYLVVPPSPDSVHSPRFEFSAHKPGDTWAPCSHTGRWRPLPTCDDDPTVVEIDVALGYRTTTTAVSGNDEHGGLSTPSQDAPVA